MTSLPLSQAQIITLGVKAGFTLENAKIASAIAMCEAPCTVKGVPHSDFGAIGDQELADETWGYSYGGFQIRSRRDEKGTGKWRDELKLVDPLFNTQAAHWVKHVQGWTAWTTYKNRQYRAFLPELFPPPSNSYVVIAGDTLTRITLKLSGGKWSWQELAEANKISEPYTIHVGEVLLLPTPHARGV